MSKEKMKVKEEAKVRIAFRMDGHQFMQNSHNFAMQQAELTA